MARPKKIKEPIIPKLTKSYRFTQDHICQINDRLIEVSKDEVLELSDFEASILVNHIEEVQ